MLKYEVPSKMGFLASLVITMGARILFITIMLHFNMMSQSVAVNKALFTLITIRSLTFMIIS